MMTDAGPAHQRLVRRIEEASLNAWPAMHQLLLDGWLVRMSNGFTKRANCIVPLYPTTGYATPAANAAASIDGKAPDSDGSVLLEKIRYCENLYAREQLKTIFRLTLHSSDPSLERLLAQRSYKQLDLTQVKTFNLTDPGFVDASPTTAPGEFRLLPLADWVEHYAVLSELPNPASRLHATLIRAIRPDCAFAVLEHAGEIVACGLGVREQDLLGVFDLITTTQQRRAGHGKALLQGLLRWGAQQGARHAYLQVAIGNGPANGLYQELGFSDLYQYWYRQSP